MMTIKSYQTHKISDFTTSSSEKQLNQTKLRMAQRLMTTQQP